MYDKAKNYKCEQCDYEGSLASNLRAHILAVHDKVKNFKCELCEYSASHSGSLKLHDLAVHAKEKNHKCNKEDELGEGVDLGGVCRTGE